MRPERDLRLIVGAVGLSALGDFLALIPLTLHVQQRSGSGLAVAALYIALFSPAVLLAGVAGTVVDRTEARRLLGVTSLLQAAIAVGLAFSNALGPVLALMFLLGCANALSSPAEFALVPAVAGKDRLAIANGRVETARYVGFTLGPALGGLIAAGGGHRAALLVDAATFAAVAVAAWLLHARRAPQAEMAQDDGPSARAGIGLLFRDPVLGLVMAVAFASLLFMTASAAAEVFFAKDVLDAGDTGYGVLIASWTLGMALGATLLTKRVPPHALAVGALIGVVVQSVGIALPTLWLVLAFALGTWVIGGLAHGLKNVLVRTLIHERVPEHQHGRAMAAYNGLRNGAELLALAGGGALVVALGARWTLFLAGAVPLAAGLVGLAAYARLVSLAGTQAALVDVD